MAELQRIEQEIRTLDDEDAEDDEFILQSHIYDLNREGATRKRAELMEELNGVLKKYGRLEHEFAIVLLLILTQTTSCSESALFAVSRHPVTKTIAAYYAS